MQCTCAIAMIWPPFDIHVRHRQAPIKDAPEHHVSCYGAHSSLVSLRFSYVVNSSVCKLVNVGNLVENLVEIVACFLKGLYRGD